MIKCVDDGDDDDLVRVSLEVDSVYAPLDLAMAYMTQWCPRAATAKATLAAFDFDVSIRLFVVSGRLLHLDAKIKTEREHLATLERQRTEAEADRNELRRKRARTD
jgi:hypothetical protein